MAELATRQHGVVSWPQLSALGLTKDAVGRRVHAGRLHPLHRGVYAVGHQALTWRSRLIAAVYACGPTAVASHRAAGALHGLLSSQRLEVSAARGCNPRRGVAVHRPRALSEEDRTSVDGIPVTTVARTLVDLADVLTEERLAKALQQAEILRVFDLRTLETAATRAGKRRGRGRLERVLTAYRPEPRFFRSEAERRFKELCERHGLPMPQFNAAVEGYEIDVYWPHAGYGLEIDGAKTHNTTYAFHADRRRDRKLATKEIQVNRVTWPDLDDELAEELRQVLARR